MPIATGSFCSLPLNQKTLLLQHLHYACARAVVFLSLVTCVSVCLGLPSRGQGLCFPHVLQLYIGILFSQFTKWFNVSFLSKHSKLPVLPSILLLYYFSKFVTKTRLSNLNRGLILAEVSGRVWHSRGKLISLPTNRNWEEECKKRPGPIPKDAPLLTQFLQAGLPFLLPSPPYNNAIILWTHKPPLLMPESSGPKSFLQTPSKTLPRRFSVNLVDKNALLYIIFTNWLFIWPTLPPLPNFTGFEFLLIWAQYKGFRV